MQIKNQTLEIILVKALLISFVSIAFASLATQLYASVSGIGVNGWGILGRWFVMLFHGQYYTSAILAMPAVPYEDFIGLSGHIVIGFIFSTGYVCFIQQDLPALKQLCHSVVFSLCLAVFPLFLELPSMGSGVLGLSSPEPLMVIIRVLSNHFCFGLGLGVGSILLQYLNQHRSG